MPSLLVFLLWRATEFVKCFFYSYWDDHVAFILPPFNVLYYTNWFACVEPPLDTRSKSHVVVMYDPFNVLLNLVCNILLRIFASAFIQDIGLLLSIFCSDFGFENVSLMKWVWKVFLLQFLEEFQKDWC